MTKRDPFAMFDDGTFDKHFDNVMNHPIRTAMKAYAAVAAVAVVALAVFVAIVLVLLNVFGVI